MEAKVELHIYAGRWPTHRISSHGGTPSFRSFIVQGWETTTLNQLTNNEQSNTKCLASGVHLIPCQAPRHNFSHRARAVHA